jgi:PLD-like domain
MPRTKNHLLTAGIWESITAAAKTARKPSYVAVAYFGQGASNLLPLRANSRLVVDASDNAVKAGQTHPADLKRLQKRGVIIYSVANLHAKIYVFDSSAFVGSANVSNNSAGTLIESMVNTTDPTIVRSAKSFVDSLCLDELSPSTLDRLQKIYKPPRIPKDARPKRGTVTGSAQANLRRLFLTQLVRHEPPKGSEAAQERGLKAAMSRRKHGRTYEMQDFNWYGKATFQRDDKIIQVIKEDDGRRLIDAPADIIHMHRWQRNGRRVTFVYLEVPKVRRISLEKLAKRLGYGAKKKLQKNGLVRDREFAEALYKNWKSKS